MSAPAGVRAAPGGAELAVLVKPRAPRSELCGVRDGAFEVRVAAPPVDDAANDELVRLLAKALGVPRSAVEVARGERSRHKGVRVRGLTPREVEERLGAAVRAASPPPKGAAAGS